jgi:hypothetical protein
MWGILRSILGSKASDVSIVMSFDPLGREIEASPNGNFEVWEVCVFNIPFRGKLVSHLTMDCLIGFDGLEQSITD